MAARTVHEKQGDHVWNDLSLRTAHGRKLELDWKHSEPGSEEQKKYQGEMINAFPGSIKTFKAALATVSPLEQLYWKGRMAVASKAMMQFVIQNSIQGTSSKTSDVDLMELNTASVHEEENNYDKTVKCWHCGKILLVEKGSKVEVISKKCGRCRTAIYCNQTCRKAHWKVHKPDCKV